MRGENRGMLASKEDPKAASGGDCSEAVMMLYCHHCKKLF